jgi:flagellar basal-body rod modification protein FlgD
MDVGSIAAQSGATSQVAGKKLAENFDNFLKLLTTQLKFQDPLSPLDSKEFVGQLVQFTQVEQAIATNKKMDQLLALQQGNLTSVGLDYIGKTVEATGDVAPLTGESAEFSYTLTEGAASTAMAIVNGQGQAVYTTQGETEAGRHGFVWDGLDNDGNALPEGPYRFVVTAVNADGDQIGVSTTTIAQVTGVENGETGLLLQFGDVKVPFENVVAVKETPQPPA